MKDKQVDFLKFGIEAIAEEYLDMTLNMSINLEDSIDTSDSFFTTFYNIAAYCFNYALDVMTPLAGNICNYFGGSTNQYDVDYL